MPPRIFLPRPLYPRFLAPRLPHSIQRYIRHSSSASTSSSRIDKFLNRLPKFLHPYTRALRTAPVSHITSFLILHEITAIVPLIGLATAFHYAGLGERWATQGEGGWFGKDGVLGRGISEGVERFGRYFGGKGWFGFTRAGRDTASSTESFIQESAAEVVPAMAMDSTPTPSPSPPQPDSQVSASIENKFHPGERGTRILIEVATAYAITKVLLPARIVLSVWAAPWFARVLLGRRGLGRFGGVFSRGGRGGNVEGMGGGRTGAAGTGATGGGVGSLKKGA